MAANMNNLAGDHGTPCASAATANVNKASAVAGVNEGIAGWPVTANSSQSAMADPSHASPRCTCGPQASRHSTTAGFPAQITPGADVISNQLRQQHRQPNLGADEHTFDTLTNDGRGGAGTLLFFSAGNANSDLDITFARHGHVRTLLLRSRLHPR